MRYTISTTGPGFSIDAATLAEAKQFVERCTPMKRGWTGEWTQTRHGAWVYTRRNSKGAVLHGFQIVMRRVHTTRRVRRPALAR